jgi:hypothetical protein
MSHWPPVIFFYSSPLLMERFYSMAVSCSRASGEKREGGGESFRCISHDQSPPNPQNQSGQCVEGSKHLRLLVDLFGRGTWCWSNQAYSHLSDRLGSAADLFGLVGGLYKRLLCPAGTERASAQVVACCGTSRDPTTSCSCELLSGEGVPWQCGLHILCRLIRI